MAKNTAHKIRTIDFDQMIHPCLHLECEAESARKTPPGCKAGMGRRFTYLEQRSGQRAWEEDYITFVTAGR